MKTDYPELEGPDHLIKYDTGKEIFDGLVVGCNYHIGVTIVDANNTDNYLSCLIGPSSPQIKTIGYHSPRYLYRRLFHYRVKCIKEGIVIGPELVKFGDSIREIIGIYVPNSHPTADSCPYNT